MVTAVVWSEQGPRALPLVADRETQALGHGPEDRLSRKTDAAEYPVRVMDGALGWAQRRSYPLAGRRTGVSSHANATRDTRPGTSQKADFLSRSHAQKTKHPAISATAAAA